MHPSRAGVLMLSWIFYHLVFLANKKSVEILYILYILFCMYLDAAVRWILNLHKIHIFVILFSCFSSYHYTEMLINVINSKCLVFKTNCEPL